MLTDLGFVKLKYSQFANVRDRELSLREEPAIYTWYREINFTREGLSSSSLDYFLEKELKKNHSAEHAGKVGAFYNIKITENAGSLPKTRLAKLREIDRKSSKKEAFLNLLETTNDISSPLYIGKAENLQRRIHEHVTGQSGLLQRLESAGIEMRECYLLCKYIPEEWIEEILDLSKEEENFEEEKRVLLHLVEDLMTRLSPAPFVKRIG